jgi:hypothetical protein
MHSFIITLTYKGSAVIFRFVSTKEIAEHIFEVSALNERSFAPFVMQYNGGEWKITSGVPEDMKELEEKLGVMINAYLEGR